MRCSTTDLLFGVGAVQVVVQGRYKGSRSLAEMQSIHHRTLDQGIAVQTLEELAPRHGDKLRLRLVLQAPRHLARGISPVGMSAPLLHSVVVQPALHCIQLLSEPLERLVLVELAKESLIRWRQLPGLTPPRFLVLKLLPEELLQLRLSDGLIVRLESRKYC